MNEKQEEKSNSYFCFSSLCSLVCKWNYSANPNGKNGWDEDFFEQLNLRDLKKDNWRKIGTLSYLILKIENLVKKNALLDFH